MSEPLGFRPQLLPLEDRLTPAGDVTARVVDGILLIDGDARANAVTIAGTGWHSVAIRPGDDDTTINGKAGNQPLFLGGIHEMVIRTGDGEDTVRLENLRARYKITVDTGGGEDEVDLVGVDARKPVQISTGAAKDAVNIIDSKFNSTVAVDTGDGDDRVQVSGSKFRGRTFWVGGHGHNGFGRTGNKFTRAVTYSGFETVLGTLLPPPVPPPAPPDNGQPPTVTLTSSAGESTAAAQVPFDIQFSEAVTGLTQNELGVTNGTLTGFTAVSPTEYTVSVIPAADGAITLSLPANVAVDSTGNGNLAATPLTVRSIRTDAGMTNIAPSPTDPNFVPAGNGLATWDVQVGSGRAVTANSTVQVFYTGWLASNGTVFDSARVIGQPASFALSNLIPGFRQGIIGMQLGGIRRLLIPPDLAYGPTGTSSIPPNSTLIFEVKLVAVS